MKTLVSRSLRQWFGEAMDSETHGSGGLAAAVGVEGEDDVLGKVGRVGDGLGEGEVLQILDSELVEGGGFAPVAVWGKRSVRSPESCLFGASLTLEHDDSALDGLAEEAGDGAVGQVTLVTVGGAFTGSEEYDLTESQHLGL